MLYSIFWAVWEILINVIDCILIFLILTSSLKLKKDNSLTRACSIIILIVICTLANALCTSSPQLLIVLTATLCIYSFLLTEGTIVQKIFWPFFVQIIFWGVDLLHISLVRFLWPNIDVYAFVGPGPVRFLDMIITRFELSCIVLLLRKKRLSFGRFSKMQLVILVICPLASCVALYALIEFFFETQTGELNIVIASFMICGVNALFFYLLHSLTTVYEKNRYQELLLQKQIIDYSYFKQIHESFLRLRSWKHDIKQHMQVIQNLAEQSKDEKVVEYIQKAYGSIVDKNTVVYTNNSTIDAVLSYELFNATQKSIHVKLDLSIPVISGVDDLDLCSVIANIWENAIEGCEQLGDADKYIIFRCHYKNGFFAMNCKNSALDKTKADLISDKSGPDHGIGISNIKHIVQKYNGFYDFQPHSDQFEVSILIPIKTEDTNPTLNIFVWDNRKDAN